MKSLFAYKELVVFDCETTGLDPINHQIIELACCRFLLDHDHYVLQEQYDRLVKAKDPLPSNIVDLTGITDEMLARNGLDERIVATYFYDNFIANSSNKKLYIAYNAPFDIHFVGQLLRRNGLAFLNNSHFLDVLTIFKDRASYPHKLVNAIALYKLDGTFINSHRAIDDCLACYEVLKTMAKNCDDLIRYVNLFGYNPKYPPVHRINGVRYKPQPYDSYVKLYEMIF